MRCRVDNKCRTFATEALPWFRRVYLRTALASGSARRSAQTRSAQNRTRARRRVPDKFRTARVESLRFGVFSGSIPFSGSISVTGTHPGVTRGWAWTLDATSPLLFLARRFRGRRPPPRRRTRRARPRRRRRVSRRTNAPPPTPRSTTSVTRRSRTRGGDSAPLKETRHLSLNETRHLSLNETRHLSLSSRRPSRVRGGVRLCRRVGGARRRALAWLRGHRRRARCGGAPP